jgi:hypothetical protein
MITVRWQCGHEEQFHLIEEGSDEHLRLARELRGKRCGKCRSHEWAHGRRRQERLGKSLPGRRRRAHR